MSKIGKQTIQLPKDVQVRMEGSMVHVEGPKGKLSRHTFDEIEVEIKEDTLSVHPKKEKLDKQTKAFWGTERSLIANMIQGVSEGFVKKLELEGVGYKASVEGNNLVLHVGFSHSVKIEAPEGITFAVEKNVVSVSGIVKEVVGQIAATIRKIRPPEPYKGTGIRYQGEHVRRKAGKRVGATGT